MEFGLIGEHLPHSFSKEIHRRCAGYEYQLHELTPEELPAFLTERSFQGINVTIPYKQAVIPYLEFVDEAASGIGAVNTVVNRDGVLHGYNTDFYGMTALLRRMGISLEGKKVLILGTGGTSHTAQAVAKAMGAGTILTVGRPTGPAPLTVDQAYEAHADAHVIINTTPCGMYPYADGAPDRAGTPIEIARFPNLCGVADAVYNPLRTNLVLDAQQRGLPAEGGLFMLVAQGVMASKLFLNAPLDEALLQGETQRIYEEIRREKENIVLTGMPASGKTTIGTALSERLGRPFFDTDREIVKGTGRSIPDLFAQVGEAGFRDLESAVIKDLAARVSGSIIATGGGSVLRDENVRALRRTGKLYFLDRALEHLLPSNDRPLASSREAIARRYHERYPRYLATCDRQVVCDEVPEHTVEFIRKDFFA